MKSTFARTTLSSFGGLLMNNHRVISISLNEQDWQALMRLHPQPVLWLREKIQESLQAGDAGVGSIASPSATAAANTTSATTR